MSSRPPLYLVDTVEHAPADASARRVLVEVASLAFAVGVFAGATLAFLIR